MVGRLVLISVGVKNHERALSRGGEWGGEVVAKRRMMLKYCT